MLTQAENDHQPGDITRTNEAETFLYGTKELKHPCLAALGGNGTTQGESFLPHMTCCRLSNQC